MSQCNGSAAIYNNLNGKSEFAVVWPCEANQFKQIQKIRRGSKKNKERRPPIMGILYFSANGCKDGLAMEDDWND